MHVVQQFNMVIGWKNALKRPFCIIFMLKKHWSKFCNINLWIENDPPLRNFSENSSVLVMWGVPEYLIFQRDQQHSEDITVQRERKGREDELKVLFENIELQKRWGYILVATCNLFSVIQENFVALGETLWWGEIEIKVFQGNQAKWYGFCWWWQIWKSSSLLYYYYIARCRSIKIRIWWGLKTWQLWWGPIC